MLKLRLWAVAAGAAISASGATQSFNIDINSSAEPELGGGPPSNAFGAASGQTGYWNAVPLLAPGPLPLQSLSGGATTVQITMAGGFTGYAFRFEGNTGDHAKLMND